MSLLPSLRCLLALFSSLRNWKGPLKRLLLLWRYLKRCLGLERENSRSQRREIERGGRRREGRGDGRDSHAGTKDHRELGWREEHVPATDGHSEVVASCASRRPLSALELHLDRHGQFLQPTDIPTRPASMVIPGQSPAHNDLMLHPYSHTPSNNSASDISISVQSTSDGHRGRRLEVAHARPDARPTSRAAARGIARVASRAPSRATSPSRSRARSRTPAHSVIDLPQPHIFPNAPTTPSNSSRHTLALPDASVAGPSPETVPSISLPVPEEHRQEVYPVMQIPRYDQYPTVPPDRVKWPLMPVTTHFGLDRIPRGWTACTHPEGRLYFYHAERRIYTDNDVRDEKTSTMLEAFANLLDELVREQDLILPANHDLVLCLEKRRTMPGFNWIYYYADHATRSLFWVQQCDPHDDLELDEISAFNGPYDIKCEIESKYWEHLDMYPHGHSIPVEVYNELNGILMFACTDAVTSMTTTVTYRPDDVYRMIGLLKSAKAVDKSDFATAVVGRIMSIWYHNRWLNFHGQTHARLNRDQSVYNPTPPRRTPLIRILGPLFWNAPLVHLRGLEKIWIDGIIAIIPWSSFISRLQDEWREFVLYATVLLNANVALLAIPTVVDPNGPVTTAEITSYLSIVASVGCILVGLLLIRQHRVKSKDTAEDANNYLNSRKHETLGIETLAIIYSLPYALLMWGMVTFLLAFSFECFSTGNKVASFTTGAVWIAVAVLVCWTIITGWESNGESSIWEILKHRWGRLFPEHDAADDSATAAVEDHSAHSARSATASAREKPERKWWTRIRGGAHVHSLPHSSDPPMTEMRETSSVV